MTTIQYQTPLAPKHKGLQPSVFPCHHPHHLITDVFGGSQRQHRPPLMAKYKNIIKNIVNKITKKIQRSRLHFLPTQKNLSFELEISMDQTKF